MTMPERAPRTPTYGYVVRLDESTEGRLLYVAEYPELPGCMAHGSTMDEALANLEDARELYAADLRERGLPIPAPSRNPFAATPGSTTFKVTAVDAPMGRLKELV